MVLHNLGASLPNYTAISQRSISLTCSTICLPSASGHEISYMRKRGPWLNNTPTVLLYVCLYGQRIRCTAWVTQFSRDAEMAIGQSPPLGPCHSSIATAAASAVLLLSMMISLFGCVKVWKVFFITLCPRGCIVLCGGFVHGPATTRYLLLTRNKLG